ncbi:hypothetical protein [Halorussus halophilus]|uniref:hypothetical protein n=1 Tax=Halorussus halophilus TaxID=2650975 RepID=UPI001300ED3C|nr:hypothetical protein [Halorussus halophilus]
MSSESVPRSLQYALTRELLRLYAVVLAGWVMIGFSGSVGFAPFSVFDDLLQLLLFLVGFFLVMSGLVAIAHRVLSDTVR